MADGRENLIPYQFQSGDEAREAGRKGGIASGAARRRKRSMKEAADLFLSLPVSNKKIWNALSRADVDPEDIDNQMAIVAGLTKEAMGGNAAAAKVLIDLLGEDHKETGGEVQIIDDL